MNKGNLLLLATYLEALPENYHSFDMRTYCTENDGTSVRPDEVKDRLPECGTVACAMGHAPLVPGLEPLVDEWWTPYCVRVLDIEPGGNEWAFMFDTVWIDYEPTPKEAAERIRHCVAHGAGAFVEYGYDWREYA